MTREEHEQFIKALADDERVVFVTETGRKIRGYKGLSEKIEVLSIQPGRPTGHWIAHQEGQWIYAKCSECNSIHDVKTNYCPDCGRQMGGKP